MAANNQYNPSASYEESGVFELLTELCKKTAAKCPSQNRVSQRSLTAKMRAHSFEIILKKSPQELPEPSREPISGLLAHYFTACNTAKNPAEYKRSVELKKVISTVRHTDFGEQRENVHGVLKLLVGLSNTVKDDLAAELFQSPFSFGVLDAMLPKPPRTPYGSFQPYSYYPNYVFELPYALKAQAEALEKQTSPTYSQYTVESFDSNSLMPKTVQSLIPQSLPSITSTRGSSYNDPAAIFNYPRLSAPRDLLIPSSPSTCNIVRVSQPSDSANVITEESSGTNVSTGAVVDIWELASQVDTNIPADIWEIVSKMPASMERQLIASSSREAALWQQVYGHMVSDLTVLTERQLIRHIMYLIIGVETTSFPYSRESNCFYMKDNLSLVGVSREHLKGYLSELLLVGTYYRRLYQFAFNQTLEDVYSDGLIYEAAREVVRRYLLSFRLSATQLFPPLGSERERECLPTLLQILSHMAPLRREIETVAATYRAVERDPKASIPKGAELMSYMFNEISLVTHRKTALTMYDGLISICAVYFKFIERFIFEGELDDRFNEFFIRKDASYVNSRTKRYWDRGFHIAQSVAIPEFLRPLAKCILLCGKSLRLLKLCNPSEPLVVLISAEHPSVVCCDSFSRLERQRRALGVYRTRCLFVSGEPASLQQILLKREAERKAFTEQAQIKQQDTHDKIVAERKRLAQLIIAEKQHSLRVLEAAMLEAKVSKNKAWQRERRRSEMERAAERASEEVDARLRDDEKNKMMQYYTKLNMEVEKSKLHMVWKMKRLQLDQSRMQLLSTEERNLKREKLELQHQRNEEVMAMSIKSDEGEDFHEYVEVEPNVIEETNARSTKKQATDVFSAICNVAKSFFGAKTDGKCDNKKDLDSQGNIVNDVAEGNYLSSKTSSDVIGSNLNEKYDNLQFLKIREEAVKNRQKVMMNEFGETDKENNTLKQVLKTDHENNLDSAYEEAKRNKLKVLGAEREIDTPEQCPITVEPRTQAQIEALMNKRKVLGVEFNLPPEEVITNDPANIAQAEALVNKQKILGVKYNLPPVEIIRNDPANIAQEEAATNKQKILGVEYNLPSETKIWNDPANLAQEEAVVNKNRIMGVEYNLPPEAVVRNDSANIAQEEAATNRHKALGVDFNLPPEIIIRKEPASFAQEEALKNRNRMESDFDSRSNLRSNSRLGLAKREGLTLDLKSFGDTGGHCSGLTPNTGAITPAEFFSRLDLETPTTADIPLTGQIPGDLLTPRSESGHDIEQEKPTKDKEFLTSDGFNFTIMVDEDTVDHDASSEAAGSSSTNNSPVKRYFPLKKRSTNILDGSYSLEDFDPFGLKDIGLQDSSSSKSTFTSKMDSDMMMSCYTHPAVIMEEVQKKPYKNIFASHFGRKDEEETKTECDNIATLTACLQRSVMLPLTYQLEVVNNSILTYFLVDLDMYEHLRSLKDYFFLMDGEFSRSICHNLFAQLTKTLYPQELLNFATLHNVLDKALGSSISHLHKFSENLSFTITSPPLSFAHSSPDALSCLSLTYAVQWPLNIILSAEALVRYSRVFQFLLKMRRVAWLLAEDFASLKLTAKLAAPHSRALLRSPHYISIQLSRHVMSSLVRALDNYIVTTCILTSWKEFEGDLTKARTLDDLYDCHVVYIKKVLFRCLLNNRSTPVMKLLNDIFTVILKFSRVLKAGEWQHNEATGLYTHQNFTQLEELFHLFEKLAKYLHKVVTRLMECGYQRHLAELLTLVNLNGYYDLDRSKGHGSTIQSP